MSQNPEPDTKDWTWVLDTRCPDCHFEASSVPADELAGRFTDNAAAWVVVLAGPGATVRPEPRVWSALEYACHVRDVHRVFADRVDRMLGEDSPQFANWDQDETALEQRYDLQDPAVVAPELLDSAARAAQRYAAVAGAAWERPGLRSDGSRFTVESLGRYHLHDVVHHLHDLARTRPGAPPTS